MPQPDHFPRLPPTHHLDLYLLQRRMLDDQVELWWFRKPRRSLLCYAASVCMVLGLGLGGVGLLSTTPASLSGQQWRLAAGTALCLLALAVLLKQLLSSAVQDMNCVRSRRRVEQMKSGGRADPVLMFVVGLTLTLGGGALLYSALASGQHRPGEIHRDMFLSGLGLLTAGAATSLAVAGYFGTVRLQERRSRRRRRGGRTLRSGGVRVLTVAGGPMGQAMGEASSSRISLI
ncbi:transmembrane protein 125 [Aplochiton taeniatus]